MNLIASTAQALGIAGLVVAAFLWTLPAGVAAVSATVLLAGVLLDRRGDG